MDNVTAAAPTSSGSGGIAETPHFLIASYALVGAVGILGNGLVLIILIASKELHTVTNLFIANQSLVDLVSSIFLLVSFIGPTPGLPKRRLAATALCLLWNSDYIFWGSVVTSTFNLVIITLERYFAVIHPIAYRRHFSIRRAGIMVAVIWLLGYGFQTYTFTFHGYSQIDEECATNFTSEAFKAFIGSLVFVVEYLIPLIVMVFVYGSIQKSLRQRVGVVTAPSSNENHQRQPDSVHGQASGNHPAQPGDRRDRGPQGVVVNYRVRARRNVIKTFVIVSVTYFICWTPNHVTFLWFFLGGELDFRSVPYFFTVILAFVNMCVNPFIYTFKWVSRELWG